MKVQLQQMNLKI